MDNLPIEILHSIFILVRFRNIIECMFVCRQWRSTLRRCNLLNDVRIDKMELYNDFMNMLHRIPNCGDQVEILRLKIYADDKFDYQYICNMLPNLRELDLFNLDELNNNFYDDVEPPILKYTNSKLEIIKENVECQLTRRLIASNTLTSLRSLDLTFNTIRELGEDFFVYLKNSPALENITLKCIIGISDLEILHESVSRLKTFHLTCIALDDFRLPRNIIPATLVKTLSMHIDEAMVPDQLLKWYEYLIKKYTNLIDFEYEDNSICECDAKEAMVIYRDGILPLYRNVRKQRNTFHVVNVPTKLDIFNKLSNLGHRFESFNLSYNKYESILTQLAESDYLNHVNHISLIHTAIPSPMIFQNFASLTTLTINANGRNSIFSQDANLTDYFNGLPSTLTSFKAAFRDVKISKLPTYPNNIEELHLNCTIIYPELGEVISRFFPKLNRLNLIGCVTEDLNIDLPNNHFKVLSVEAYYKGTLSNVFSITNARSSLPRYYIGKETDKKYSSFNTVPTTVENMQGRVVMNLKYTTANRPSFYIIRNSSRAFWER